MSIKVMSAVWENSPRRGAELLVLLALADWSNDRGEGDSSYTQLATKAKIDDRRVRRIVAGLEADGELAIEIGGGFTFAKGAVSNKITLTAYVGAGKYAASAGGGYIDPQGGGTGAPGGGGTGTPHNGQLLQSTSTEYPSIVNETMDGAPVAPAGHSANGTGPAPAKTRTRRKATARTPLQLGQGSTIYRDVVKLTPNEAQRAMLDAAFEKHGERAMRDGLARWLAKGWSPKNVPGMVDFLDGGDRGRREEAKTEAFWASVQW